MFQYQDEETRFAMDKMLTFTYKGSKDIMPIRDFTGFQIKKSKVSEQVELYVFTIHGMYTISTVDFEDDLAFELFTLYINWLKMSMTKYAVVSEKHFIDFLVAESALKETSESFLVGINESDFNLARIMELNQYGLDCW